MPFRRRPTTAAKAPGPMGWIPPDQRTAKQWENHERCLMVALARPDEPPDQEVTAYTSAEGSDVDKANALADYARCVIASLLSGMPLRQALVSCLAPGPVPPPPVPPPVPPGPTPGKKGYLWWPYTYGQSRHRMGDDSEGEGCTGGAWAAAAKEDGIFFEEETPEVEPGQLSQGWYQMSSRDEYKWSAGPWAKAKYGTLAAAHIVREVVAVKDADDAMARIMAGYCLTHASDYGTSTIRQQGTPPVMLATWDGSWSHQMSCSDAWEHPTLGLIFDDDNQWGPDAHPAPTSGEDPGGFWIPAKDYTRICKSGEVFAFKGFQGLSVRQIRTLLDNAGVDAKRWNHKEVAQKALGEFYRRIKQTTGSCVGAGGGTMLTHLYGLELAAHEELTRTEQIAF